MFVSALIGGDLSFCSSQLGFGALKLGLRFGALRHQLRRLELRHQLSGSYMRTAIYCERLHEPGHARENGDRIVRLNFSRQMNGDREFLSGDLGHLNVWSGLS